MKASLSSIPIIRRASATRSLGQICKIGKTLLQETDAQLRDRSLALRFRASSGDNLSALMPEAYALVREAAARTIGMRHYKVQLTGGIHLASRNVIEMATGEGKTLTATLPVYLHALHGKGSHLATSNDYLAQRDAEQMRPVYELLAMSVGIVTEESTDDERRAAYACDITYGSNTQFGFDFLRDRLRRRPEKLPGRSDSSIPSEQEVAELATQEAPVMRELFFLLADEADSLMIDEAGTPLIIGAERPDEKEQQSAYVWASKRAADAIEKTHYRYEVRDQKVELTKAGRAWVREQSSKDGLDQAGSFELYEMMQRAVKVERDYHRDQQYVVRDDEVIIVSEHTGRLGEGREWHDGLHQAIQAREGLPITLPTAHAARITYQALFLSYRNLAGMTGTARSAAAELRKVYKVGVVPIPTNKPCLRAKFPTRHFASEAEKRRAIVNEAIDLQGSGRAVLIGTRSVEKSQQLSDLMRAQGIPHRLLNAHSTEDEAAIVETAGAAEQITIATSIAGRGTDIKLDDSVREVGGLHVILTELDDSPRIDRQLIGRCARQGDPGSYRHYLCMEDKVLEVGFGVAKATEIRNRCTARPSRAYVRSILAQAQSRVESKRRRDRYAMLYHEKRKLRNVWELGLDPILDVAD